jgi:predicted Zn-dependent peptidase
MRRLPKNEVLFRTAELGPGFRLHLRRTRAFKTVTACLVFHTDLDEHAAARAVIPRVLARGTRRHPSLRAIQVELDQLYGASLHGEADRAGERQLLQFRSDWVTDRLAGTSLMREMADFLAEYVGDPARDDRGRMRAEIFEQERKVLEDEAASVIDDKARYSHHRLVEEMCRNEAFARPAIGRLEEIRALEPPAVDRAYGLLLERAPVDLFLLGHVTWKDAVAFAKRLGLARRERIARLRRTVRPRVGRTRTVREKGDVRQAWLWLGFRTTVRLDGPLYPSLMLMNALFGGSPLGKLFTNVREKESLCYAVFSSLERSKGLVFVGAGIDGAAYARARRLILKQLDDLRAGRIEPGMLERARENLLGRLAAMRDSPGALIDFALERAVNGLPADLRTLETKLEGLGERDVARAAKTLALDTVYLLHGS